uniref:FERM domain-containing protein n=1 Tax=Xenopus tropicalis TaxID=8364 RepID=A0A803KAR6_XENTR
LCYLTSPNLTDISVEREGKANKELCKNKVKKLGIVFGRYFGFNSFGPKGKILWQDLLDSISNQFSALIPFGLSLRLKIFSEKHFILQATEMHGYFLAIAGDLLAG